MELAEGWREEEESPVREERHHPMQNRYHEVVVFCLTTAPERPNGRGKKILRGANALFAIGFDEVPRRLQFFPETYPQISRHVQGSPAFSPQVFVFNTCNRHV